MRYLVMIGLAATLLAACGSGRGAPPAPARARPARAATLVAFQRNGGLAATLDALTVGVDGSARLDKRYGGAGRRTDSFRLTGAALARLRGALRALPRQLPEAGGGAANAATYLLTYRGRALAAREDALPARGARAFRILAGLVDRGAQ